MVRQGSLKELQWGTVFMRPAVWECVYRTVSLCIGYPEICYYNMHVCTQYCMYTIYI